MGFIYKSHQKMYEVKKKNNWIMEGNTHIVHIDTKVSALSERFPISHWWHLPAVVGILFLFVLPQTRKYFGADPVQWIYPSVVLFTAILFWGLHLWAVHRKNIVYSEDSSVNLAINQLEKRTWSILMLSVNYLNLFSLLYLTIKIISNRWLYDMDYFISILMQMIVLLIIVVGIYYKKKKRNEVLAMDSHTLVVDDDEYWKNGWYNNPNDNHLLVQDRMCSTNFTLNMAKPAAKIISAATAVFITVTIVVVFWLILSLENAKIAFLINGNQVTIDAAMYDTHFMISDIQSIEIIEKMPEDDFTRTNGGATEKYLIGHFKGKETGNCLMYLYRDYVPVLEIKLSDKTIYVNSKNVNEIEKWYEELSE